MPWTRTTPSRLARWRERARWLVGGAWFFIVFSLLNLFWVVGTKWPDPAGLTTLYQTTVRTPGGEETHRALGLAYDGAAGLVLALVQAAGVVTAAVFSTSANRRRRRIGHALLVGWAGLWMGNLLHLASIDWRLDSIGQATLLTALFACTVYRALAPRRRQAERPAAGAADPIGAEAAPPTADAIAVEPADPPAPAATDPSVPARPDPAPAPRFARVRAAGARTLDGGRRAAARLRERGVPLAASGGRRLGAWLRAKGVLPATSRTG